MLAKKMRDAKKTSRQTEATEAISHYLSTVSGKAVALSFEGVMCLKPVYVIDLAFLSGFERIQSENQALCPFAGLS
jgi:hypothetical protein